jgi:hypothetical protein
VRRTGAYGYDGYMTQPPCMSSGAGKMGRVMNNSSLPNELVDPDDDECDHDKLCDSDDD